MVSRSFIQYISWGFCGTDIGNRSGGCRDEIVVQRLCIEKNQDIRKRCGIVPAFFDTIKPLIILQEAERFYADTESSSVYNFSY